ncbi:hypothetical protein FEM48_Zijuj01G0199600 [Ziziphus jujuba var. spinosa]|uniref:cytochrome-b5 reductase n=1 Tax=Ziziphus jujuba var. spinosa TaxID=714518 RepID=A0A978W392_ZIZJJ|nr:hypothetical protein FEM48_Zijuj01G0199600 [Ziziphus jujuba var. spinosa]
MHLGANPNPVIEFLSEHLQQFLVESLIYTMFPHQIVVDCSPPQCHFVEQFFVCIYRYATISDPDAKGYFDLLIKVYPEGKMSQHFASLKPGNVVEVKG